MRHKLGFGVGVAALVAGTVGVLAPQAAAQELAPGVSCEGFVCRNDTDDTYRVEGVASCSDWYERRMTGQVPVRERIRPHTTVTISVSCGRPDDVTEEVLWIDYRGAVVDNTPRTGSAG
ncbi:hypothetical protein NONI108955_42665 [Nocardia ninae]|uniref:Secreted protein n=1 Tax=Nocardia ninae NBRC 108245 TaxID=1210091 RepID=A0A511MTB7_9NOCA|nr:hypothetical protein [Nocardia ninae]GEM43835.1 hypothetical protein NN4_83540 [Nocardia ninae NBRC 108245]